MAHCHPASGASSVPRAPAQGAAEREPSRGSVVVIDDDPDVRDSLTILLETHRFRVGAYGSVGEFLTDARPERADCLVIDHHMPGMNGLEWIDRMQDEGVVVPIVLITGRLDPKIAARAADLGVTAVLEKPFPVAQLVRLLSDSLDRA